MHMQANGQNNDPCFFNAKKNKYESLDWVGVQLYRMKIIVYNLLQVIQN